MIGAFVFVAALLVLLAWLLLSRRPPPARARTWDPDDDPGETDAAEQEVKELGTYQNPDEDYPGSDWGPGVPRQG